MIVFKNEGLLEVYFTVFWVKMKPDTNAPDKNVLSTTLKSSWSLASLVTEGQMAEHPVKGQLRRLLGKAEVQGRDHFLPGFCSDTWYLHALTKKGTWLGSTQTLPASVLTKTVTKVITG